MSKPLIGRRRCQIPEHRKQIASLQKWCKYLTTVQYSNYLDRQLLIDNYRFEISTLQLKIKELEQRGRPNWWPWRKP